MTEQTQGTQEPVVLPAETLANGGPRSAIDGNIEVVNALRAEYFEFQELPHDALLSYYVDYYMAQVLNGGFSQFVYNSRWRASVVALVEEGLARIGAERHAASFRRGAALAESPAFPLASFLDGNTGAKTRSVIAWDEVNVEGAESLEALNESWLRARPNLVVLAADELAAYITRKASALPDREARRTRARAAEPRYMKIIRALCAAAGHALDRINAGDPAHLHEGQKLFAWHFLTDQGHHYMVETGGRAFMFNGTSKKKVAELEMSRDRAVD